MFLKYKVFLILVLRSLSLNYDIFTRIKFPRFLHLNSQVMRKQTSAAKIS